MAVCIYSILFSKKKAKQEKKGLVKKKQPSSQL